MQTRYYKPWVEEGGDGKRPPPKKRRLWPWAIPLILLLAGAAAVAVTYYHTHTDPSVAEVLIYWQEDENHIGIGSGTLVSPNGIILTCQHVAADAAGEDRTLIVRLRSSQADYKDYPATVVSKGAGPRGKPNDPADGDWAIIKINEVGLPYLKIGESRPPAFDHGAPLLALGYPASNIPAGFPLDRDRGPICSHTPGVVDSLITEHNELTPDRIVHTCQIQEGNSGGALLNDRDELVGIVDSYTAPGSAAKPNAIPIHRLNKALDGQTIAHPR